MELRSYLLGTQANPKDHISRRHGVGKFCRPCGKRLARHVDSTCPISSEIERAACNVGLDNLEKLALGLEVELGGFICGRGAGGILER